MRYCVRAAATDVPKDQVHFLRTQRRLDSFSYTKKVAGGSLADSGAERRTTEGREAGIECDRA
uniref:Uncharacterized protein n=1 Tax=Hyaloperonospora arabidopsidis (strain Emoy2) TaxID=559515 RepID=M4BZM9_HYAAE